MKEKEKMHSAIPELLDQHRQGKLDRREFLRFATLTGMSVAAASALVGVVRPGSAQAAPVQRGGVLKVASAVQKVTHPAQFSWVTPSNQLRQVAEYLTFTDRNNITHPYLLKKLAGRRRPQNLDPESPAQCEIQQRRSVCDRRCRFHHESVVEQGCRLLDFGHDRRLPGPDRH